MGAIVINTTTRVVPASTSGSTAKLLTCTRPPVQHSEPETLQSWSLSDLRSIISSTISSNIFSPSILLEQQRSGILSQASRGSRPGDMACDRPVMRADGFSTENPRRGSVIASALSAVAYSDHMFAAQYACMRPLLKGNKRLSTCTCTRLIDISKVRRFQACMCR